MEAKLCQSCGMPLSSAEVLGTNADGSLNEEYCTYCYQHGDFAQDCTMDEMIEHCAQFTDEFNKDSGMNFTNQAGKTDSRTDGPPLLPEKGRQQAIVSPMRGTAGVCPHSSFTLSFR